MAAVARAGGNDLISNEGLRLLLCSGFLGKQRVSGGNDLISNEGLRQ